MRDKDTILMESLIAEMGRARYLNSGVRTAEDGMTKKSVIPATHLNSDNPEVRNANRQRAELLINEWLEVMQTAKNQLNSSMQASPQELDEPLGHLCTAGNNIIAQLNVITYKDELLVGYEGEELTYAEILEKMLDFTTIFTIDPKSVLRKIDPETGRYDKGAVQKNFGNNRLLSIPSGSKLYPLIYNIFDNLNNFYGDNRYKIEPANNKQKQEGDDVKERTNSPVYYFSDIYNVRNDEGKVVGNWDSENGFYPNPIGIQMGLRPFSERPKGRIDRSIPNGLKKDESPVRLPFVTTIWPPANGVSYGVNECQQLKQRTTRSPRRPTDPITRGPIVGYKYKQGDFVGRNLEDIRAIVNHEEAEEAYKSKYPSVTHKAGKIANTVSNIKELEEAYQEIFNKRFLREDDDMKEFEKESEDKKDK